MEPPAGDLVRASGVGKHPGMASVFLGVNRNKRSLCLDLKAPEGAEVLRRLVGRVDALVTNVRPAGMARLGFGWEQCAAINPRLVYAVATGFGQDGPHRARPAFDEVIQAASGLAAVVGGEDGPPAFVPSLVADKITGMALLSAVLAALLHRERTGEGQLVEVPMLETLAAFVAVEHLGGTAFDPPAGPPGYERLRQRKPVRTADGWITLLPYTGAHWRAFFGAAGRPELVERLGTDNAVTRNANIGAVYAAVAEIAPARSTAAWLALCEELDIPATAFTRLEDLDGASAPRGGGHVPGLGAPDGGAAAHGAPADPLRGNAGWCSSPRAAARRAHGGGAGGAGLWRRRGARRSRPRAWSCSARRRVRAAPDPGGRFGLRAASVRASVGGR